MSTITTGTHADQSPSPPDPMAATRHPPFCRTEDIFAVPHPRIAITGPARTGKSTVLRNLMYRRRGEIKRLLVIGSGAMWGGERTAGDLKMISDASGDPGAAIGAINDLLEDQSQAAPDHAAMVVIDAAFPWISDTFNRDEWISTLSTLMIKAPVCKTSVIFSSPSAPTHVPGHLLERLDVVISTSCTSDSVRRMRAWVTSENLGRECDGFASDAGSFDITVVHGGAARAGGVALYTPSQAPRDWDPFLAPA